MIGLGSFGRWLYQQPYILLSLTALFWGGNIVIARAFAADLPPVTLSFLRWFGALLLCLPLAWPHLARDLPAIRAGWVPIVILGITGIGLYNAMAYLGLRYTQALNGLLMQSSAPVLTGIWTYLLYGERLAPRQIGGILLSLAGVLTIITQGDWTALLSLTLNPGDLWLVAGMAVYAFYAAYLRRRPAVHWASFLVATFVVGVAVHLPLFPLERLAGFEVHLDRDALIAVAYIIVFPAFLAYICFNRGVELVGPNRAAPFFHLIPVFGSALAIAFLGEAPRLHHGVGYALVLAGVFIATRR